jgi:hypothetical protein
MSYWFEDAIQLALWRARIDRMNQGGCVLDPY